MSKTNQGAAARAPLASAVARIVSPPEEVKPCSLLEAFTALALCAELNGDPRALINTCYKLLKRVKPEYQPVLALVLSSPDPVAHMKQFTATLPEHILKMDPRIRTSL